MPTAEQGPPQCFILADANLTIGTGHVMRCAILAKHLKAKGIKVSYLLSDTRPKMKEWIIQQGYEAHEVEHSTREEAPQLLAFLKSTGQAPTLLLFDSDREAFYEPAYQEALRAAGIGLAMITFHNPKDFHVHILHNQNPLALDTHYSTPQSTQKLLGLNYVILKEQYEDFHEKSRDKKVDPLSTLLLTFGGSDQWNLSRKLIGILDRLPIQKTLKVNLVLGALYQHLEEIKKDIAENRHDIHLHVNTPEMPRLMYESQLSINSGGLTVWELACCKTVNFVIPTSIREINTAKKLKSQELIHFEESFQEMSDEAISNKLLNILNLKSDNQPMADRFHQIINPMGARLVAQEMDNWFQNNTL